MEEGRADRIAYYWEGEPEGDRRAISYGDLQGEVVAFANALTEVGVQKGTAVAIYMGMVPELPVAMLACTRLGAPHTVIFGGFSADSLSARINDMGCEVLITQDEAWRRGTTVPLKVIADEALESTPGLKASIVVRRTGNDVPMRKAATTGTTTSVAPTTPPPARPSRWTPRICSSSCTRAVRPPSRRGSRTRRAGTSSERRRPTTTFST